ncbi:MAG: hypothetical protein ACXACY_20765 [Candidatus Hodarchaeales archaeon]|jgi:hypothetical protein
MKKFVYDYYNVVLETDFVLGEQQEEKLKAIEQNRLSRQIPDSLVSIVFLEAENKTKLYVIPCEWKILEYTMFQYHTVFKVRRKRNAVKKII